MYTTLIALALAATSPVEPIDPAIEVMIVETTFDAGAVCPSMNTLVPMLATLVGDEATAVDMLVAYSVEVFEEGYGQNLSAEAETRMVELIIDCLG